MKLRNDTRFFLKIISTVLLVYGIASLPSVLAALICEEYTPLCSLAAAAVICIAAGLLIIKCLDLGTSGVRQRMNYMAVISSWLIVIAVTSAVYYFSISGITLTGSVYEATAALTTTGISDHEMISFPVSMMLWRSTLNWLGGVGIILIAVSCFVSRDYSSRALVSVEIPGSEFLRPHSSNRSTYRKIILIYVLLTAVHFLLLVIAGMPAFTSLLTALSNISTAGLRHFAGGSVVHQSIAVRVIITVFAFLGSVNVSVLFFIFIGRAGLSGRSNGAILYVRRILLTAVLITAGIVWSTHDDPAHAAGTALMQTISFISTSGYIISDCSSWPLMCRVLLMIQVFIGGCALSTAGGIKQGRFSIGAGTIGFGLFRHVHPHAVAPVRIGDRSVKSDMLVQANTYISMFMLIYIFSALILSADNKNESILDALCYSQAMITNTGSSVLDMDAAGITAQFSPLSRIVMCFEMLCGRLEIYPVLMLFTRGLWRSDSSR